MPSNPVRQMEAHAERGAGGMLSLGWRLEGELSRLCIPAPAAPSRADRLWEHTCFEAFVSPASSAAYCELNFSPSGAWAAYRFAGYRQDMTALDLPSPPDARWERSAGTLTLEVALRLAALLPGRSGVLRVGLCAVIEEQPGVLSYWALRHAEGRPDFHDAAGFALKMPARCAPSPGAGP
jgi:hypothetical protein